MTGSFSQMGGVMGNEKQTMCHNNCNDPKTKFKPHQETGSGVEQLVMSRLKPFSKKTVRVGNFQPPSNRNNDVKDVIYYVTI